MLDQHGVRVLDPLSLEQPLGRGDHQVCLGEESCLQLGNVLPIGIGEGREFVDAVVDHQFLSQPSRNRRRGRQERPRDWASKSKAAHCVADLRPEQLPVRQANGGRSVKRQRQRREHMNVRFHRAHALGEGADLAPNSLQIMGVGARRAVSDPVDPKDSVVLRQQPHDVDLRKRVAAPVVGEDYDVSPRECFGPALLNLCRHPRFASNC